jgi:hypothetical protein
MYVNEFAGFVSRPCSLFMLAFMADSETLVAGVAGWRGDCRFPLNADL